MDQFSTIIINKCLQICVMFFPILIWNIFFLFQLFYAFPPNTFEILSIIFIILLIVMILFGNSFVYLHYEDKREILIYQLQKPTLILLIKNLLSSIPIVVFLLIYMAIPIFIYGIVQFLYMCIDKNHYTMSERICKEIGKIYNKHRKFKEKETILA